MTVTKDQTIKEKLTQCNPEDIADLLRKCDLGNMFTKKVAAITQSSSATLTLPEAALYVQSVRVTGGAATAGMYLVGDAGATAADKSTNTNGVCALAADGKSIVFSTTVTGATVVYVPAPKNDITAKFNG